MPATEYRTAPAAPLDAARLRAAVVVPGGVWTEIRVVTKSGSTNADALALARQGVPGGLVIAAEEQTRGRGRLDRRWLSAPGAALTFSVLLRPRSVPQSARGWLPLLAGVAAATAVRALTSVDARLKWPNDILIGDRKLAGILAEQSGDAIVVGIGLNVLGGPADLPVPTATSLEMHQAALAGRAPLADRTELLAEILRPFAAWYQRWCDSGPGDADASGLRPAYRQLSCTIGRQVNVALPGGRTLAGTATDVDAAGQLIVATDAGLVAVSAGDVVHVR